MATDSVAKCPTCGRAWPGPYVRPYPAPCHPGPYPAPWHPGPHGPPYYPYGNPWYPYPSGGIYVWC